MRSWQRPSTLALSGIANHHLVQVHGTGTLDQGRLVLDLRVEAAPLDLDPVLLVLAGVDPLLTIALRRRRPTSRSASEGGPICLEAETGRARRSASAATPRSTAARAPVASARLGRWSQSPRVTPSNASQG